MEALWEEGASVRAYDPVAGEEAKRLYGDRDDLVLADDPYDATMNADALAIVTEWNIFRSPDYAAMKEGLKQPLIFDGRNIFSLDTMQKEGFAYYSVGRNTVKP